MSHMPSSGGASSSSLPHTPHTPHPLMHRAVSPPTPAPSPQPSALGMARLSCADDAASLGKHLALVFPKLDAAERSAVLTSLLGLCSIRELSQLQTDITARLKIDFLGQLPIEISLHILSFIDDPTTLARASGVSRFWRSLVNDEHTWKAMCVKHAFRYRRMSLGSISLLGSAGLGGSAAWPAPVGSTSYSASDAYTYARLAPLAESADSSRRDDDDDDEQLSHARDDADATLLASLYQRYRARGLDPSNALHELRTLHDLFLAKQESDDALGMRRGSIDMSEADRAFYAQLEEIVAEEAEERYGAPQQAAYAQPAGSRFMQQPRDGPSRPQPFSPADGSDPFGDDAEPQLAEPSGSANLGWLGAGSWARTYAGPASSTLASFVPRLAPLRSAVGMARPPTLSRAPDAAAGSSSRGMEVDEDVFAQGLGLPVSMSGVEDPLYPTARMDDMHVTPAARRLVADAKKARRRSAPGAAAALGEPSGSSSSLGMGRPSSFVSHSGERAATFAEGSGVRPFSYKTHFKLAYLTDSNWRRGGRMLTQYTSGDNGAVVTTLAMDSEWIVVGMANAKIHVFDARTGLYMHTLAGHESGVWALTLVSRTEGARSRPGLAVYKGKHRDGALRRVPSFAAGGDLELLVHDQRPSASAYADDDEARAAAGPAGSTLSSPGLGGGGAFSALPKRTHSAMPLGDEGAPGRSDDETLEWFHRARRAMLRNGSSPNRPESLREPTAAERARERAAAEAEADAGAIRDAVMADGTGRVPRHLAAQVRANRARHLGADSDEAADFDARAAAAAAEDASLWGSAMPQQDSTRSRTAGSNPCGSVRGFGNEDALVITGGCDRDIRVWNLRTGSCQYVMRGHTSTVRCLKVVDGRPLAVSGARDSTVRVWNIATGQLVHQLVGHQHSVRCIEVAGNRVVSGSYDCTCRVWDIDTGECVQVLRGHFHQIYAVAFDGVRIATGSLDSTVRLWNANTGECVCTLQGHTSLVGQLQFTDAHLVTGGSDGRVIVFDLKTMQTKHRICAHDNSVTCLQFNDRFIVTGGNDGRVKLWDFQSGAFIREMVEPSEAVWKMAFKDDCLVVLCKRDSKTSMETITMKPLLDS